jgi:hypothetical protein
LPALAFECDGGFTDGSLWVGVDPAVELCFPVVVEPPAVPVVAAGAGEVPAPVVVVGLVWGSEVPFGAFATVPPDVVEFTAFAETAATSVFVLVVEPPQAARPIAAAASVAVSALGISGSSVVVVVDRRRLL